MINQFILRARMFNTAMRGFSNFSQVTRIPMQSQIIEMPKPMESSVDFSLFEEEEECAEPVFNCIKTQKRRELKMKKHRRQKRLKKMLLRLKSEGKI